MDQPPSFQDRLADIRRIRESLEPPLDSLYTGPVPDFADVTPEVLEHRVRLMVEMGDLRSGI